MDADRFWALIESSANVGTTQHEREEFLRWRLLSAPRADLLDFAQHLSATREPANTYRLWSAANIILHGWCSGDSFHYFQMWLVGLGRAAYDAAIADPDSLADTPAVRRLAERPEELWDDDVYPGWETLDYVAVGVGEERDDVDGDLREIIPEERGVFLRQDPDPKGDWPDDAELPDLYPRLWALFGRYHKADD